MGRLDKNLNLVHYFSLLPFTVLTFGVGSCLFLVSIDQGWAQTKTVLKESTPTSKKAPSYHPLKLIDQASTLMNELAQDNPSLPTPTWQDLYQHWKTLVMLMAYLSF